MTDPERELLQETTDLLRQIDYWHQRGGPATLEMLLVRARLLLGEADVRLSRRPRWWTKLTSWWLRRRYEVPIEDRSALPTPVLEPVRPQPRKDSPSVC